MLTAYFDASGNPNEHVLVVAGFVSSTTDWISFESEWKARLDKDHIGYFRMSEFAHSTGEFRLWKGLEDKRQSLLSDLLAIIQKHVYRKFGAAVVNSQLSATIAKAEQDAFSLAAYGVAGRGAASNVIEWLKKEKWESPVEYVFEKGDMDQDHLTRLMKEDGLPDPIFRPKVDQVNKTSGLPEKGFIPLQAADILAYEYAMIIKRNSKGVDYQSRWPYLQLEKIPGEIGKFSWTDLARIKREFVG